MSKQIMILRSAVLLVLSGLALVAWFPTETISATDEQYLTVQFLDVGQGDAIHVTTPDGFELLVDGGASAGVLRELAEGSE